MITVRWGGVESIGPLTVGPVLWLPERRTWACYWSIHRIHDMWAKLYGDDPLQAMDTAVAFVAGLIRGSAEDGIIAWWQYEGDECGFRNAGLK